MNEAIQQEFRKGDVVVCNYEHDELLGIIERKVENGYEVNLWIYYYPDGTYLRQIVVVPTSQIRHAPVVAQKPIRHKKPSKNEETEMD